MNRMLRICSVPEQRSGLVVQGVLPLSKVDPFPPSLASATFLTPIRQSWRMILGN